jgi:hypothetical protein
MRDAERLVQVEVRDIGPELARLGHPDERVHIRAVDVDLTAGVVDHRADLADRLLVHTVRRRIGDHQRRELIAVLSDLRAQVVEVDVAAFVTRNLRAARFVEQAGRPLEADDYTVIIDPAATDVRNGDVIEVVASGDEDTPDLVVMSITAGSATAGRRVFASRFGDGQVEPYVVIEQTGFGLGPFGLAEFGD